MCKELLRRLLRPLARPILDRIAARVAARLQAQTSPTEARTTVPADHAAPTGTGSVPADAAISLEIQILAAARAVAASGDHRILLPTDPEHPRDPAAKPRIGFFGNIANNAYNFTKCLRRLGHDAELVIEDGFFDAFLLNRPFWEDVEVACASYEEGLTHEPRWSQPDYVRRVAYDPALQARYQGRLSAVPEVQSLYKAALGIDLPADRALLLAQQMGHWPYLLAMKRYDVLQFSGAPISMGVFCPRPYVVFPTGSDLFISPFEETLFGLLMRSAYGRCDALLLCETNYDEYLDRLAVRGPRVFAPLMIDTDTYAPGPAEDCRTRWAQRTGGSRFLLSVCRQSWEWKGNDRLLRAFRTFVAGEGKDWALVLMAWGPDTERSRALARELGIENRILWENLVSKPVLRRAQQAADLVADQFVMPGYGTSVLEAMAAGKPVLLRPVERRHESYFTAAPPFVGAARESEIADALARCREDRYREDVGGQSLRWLRDVHGFPSVARAYTTAHQTAFQRKGGSVSCR